MDECWLILRKASGSVVTMPFASAAAAQMHIDGLGAPGAKDDNAAIASQLEVKRFVAAASLEEA